MLFSDYHFGMTDHLSLIHILFEETRPQLVFHSAAYKHVQLMDDFVSEAIQTTISGTVNIADLAVKYRVSRIDVYKRQMFGYILCGG